MGTGLKVYLSRPGLAWVTVFLDKALAPGASLNYIVIQNNSMGKEWGGEIAKPCCVHIYEGVDGYIERHRKPYLKGHAASNFANYGYCLETAFNKAKAEKTEVKHYDADRTSCIAHWRNVDTYWLELTDAQRGEIKVTTMRLNPETIAMLKYMQARHPNETFQSLFCEYTRLGVAHDFLASRMLTYMGADLSGEERIKHRQKNGIPAVPAWYEQSVINVYGRIWGMGDIIETHPEWQDARPEDVEEHARKCGREFWEQMQRDKAGDFRLDDQRVEEMINVQLERGAPK